MKRNRTLKVPIEFYNFTDSIAKQIADENGTMPNKSQAMRLLARSKIIYKGRKFDIKLL